MFEKTNPSHPDKVADRIAGAIVDLAYLKQDNPKVAVEVLIGHGVCHIINETSCHITRKELRSILKRIVKQKVRLDYKEVPQDLELAKNQASAIKCGDNGIFKGLPVTTEEQDLVNEVAKIYSATPYDGKYIYIADDDIKKEVLIICQSNHSTRHLKVRYRRAIVNPLGNWRGGIDVDSGATNRKLGSDLGAAVTGGGLHGKDLSKADVSVNIYCYLRAKEIGKKVEAYCAIGDTTVKVKIADGSFIEVKYADIVEEANDYINYIGGFEKFAEWGLIRPENK